MSGDAVKRTQKFAEETALEVVWAQWSALTSLASADRDDGTWSIIDPESLVLASLMLHRAERRLEDLVAAWAREASFLMSKPRFKSMARLFPDRAESRLSVFAQHAVEGGDTRWRSWISEAPQDSLTRYKELGSLRMNEGPGLVLRLRAGFGVSAKADLFAILLGHHGEEASLNLLIDATGFSDRTIRTATEEMVLAGFIHEIEGRPSSFHLDPTPWEAVLYRFPPRPDRPTIPSWTFWGAILAFLCHVCEWADNARSDDWTDYVASNRARNLFEEHLNLLRHAGIRPPSLPPAGETDQALSAFHELVDAVRAHAVDAL